VPFRQVFFQFQWVVEDAADHDGVIVDQAIDKKSGQAGGDILRRPRREDDTAHGLWALLLRIPRRPLAKTADEVTELVLRNDESFATIELLEAEARRLAQRLGSGPLLALLSLQKPQTRTDDLDGVLELTARHTHLDEAIEVLGEIDVARRHGGTSPPRQYRTLASFANTSRELELIHTLFQWGVGRRNFVSKCGDASGAISGVGLPPAPGLQAGPSDHIRRARCSGSC
jgi:hypothetical protein